MIKTFRLFATIITSLLLTMVPALADDTTNTQTSVYGALFQVGHLADSSTSSTTISATDPAPQPQPQPVPPPNQGNTESVLLYYPESDGFIAITTNDAGAEWWTSDKFGLNWTLATTNPLTQYGCTQAGRHSVELFNGEMYFGASCSTGALLFKVTGLTTVELVHTLSVAGQNGMALGYPTAGIVHDTLLEFFNGGYSKSTDGTTWTDVTTATNQPDSYSVPLEASSEHDGMIDVAFTSGEVAVLDITNDSYTIIGEDYLEHSDTSMQPGGANLPAIEFYNDTVWVGNQDMENGASIFTYNATASTPWTEVQQLDPDNTIVNKMELSNKINQQRFLVFFTSNAKTGANIIGIGPNSTFVPLVSSGLGGESPAHNTEVVSVIERKVTSAKKTLDVMLFGTKNQTDQTKIFALQLGGDLAFSPTSQDILSDTPTLQSSHQLQATELFTAYGQPFRMEINADQLNKGDIFTLFVNGKKVQRRRAKNNDSLILTYTAAQDLKSGDSFTIQVGRKLGYGPRNGRVLSHNMVKGDVLQVVVE